MRLQMPKTIAQHITYILTLFHGSYSDAFTRDISITPKLRVNF